MKSAAMISAIVGFVIGFVIGALFCVGEEYDDEEI